MKYATHPAQVTVCACMVLDHELNLRESGVTSPRDDFFCAVCLSRTSCILFLTISAGGTGLSWIPMPTKLFQDKTGAAHSTRSERCFFIVGQQCDSVYKREKSDCMSGLAAHQNLHVVQRFRNNKASGFQVSLGSYLHDNLQSVQLMHKPTGTQHNKSRHFGF